MTVPPIITGLQNAMNTLTKTIDAKQQELTAGFAKFSADVQANMKSILIAGPSELNVIRTADSTALRTKDGFYVN